MMIMKTMILMKIVSGTVGISLMKTSTILLRTPWR